MTRNHPYRLVLAGRCEGVTLIELLIAVAILAVIASIAVPSMGGLLAKNDMKATEIELKNDLLFARREAVGRNSRIIVCPKGVDSLTCDVTSAGKWRNGWIVCRDANQNAVCDANTAAQPNPLRDTSVTGTAVAIFGPTQIVVFNGYGEAALSTDAGVISRPNSVTFQISSSRLTGDTTTVILQRSGADTR